MKISTISSTFALIAKRNFARIVVETTTTVANVLQKSALDVVWKIAQIVEKLFVLAVAH